MDHAKGRRLAMDHQERSNVSDTTIAPAQGGFLRRPIPRPVTAHLRPSSGELVSLGG